MPASRFASRRRRSSLAHPHLKPSKYRAPKNVTFATNVTPDSYKATTSSDGLTEEALQSKLFPPSEKPRGPPKKRQPKDRRRSQGYIPRPPNAFMLFRADFVKQKHVPGSIEPSHTNLSKIIGMTWKALPEDEKQVWVNLALKEAAEHKLLYPNYKYQPRQNKKQVKRKIRVEHDEYAEAESEQHCEDVRQLLLEGLKGEELAEALAELKRTRSQTPSAGSSFTATPSATPAPSLPPDSEASGASPYFDDDSIPLMPAPASYIRRPSSVPLPGIFSYPTGFPTLPFPRMPSIDFGGGGRALALQNMHLPRRPSSAQAGFSRNWDATFESPAAQQHRLFYTMPMDEPPAAIDVFDPAYLDGTAFPGEIAWSFSGTTGALPLGSDGLPMAPQEINISPLDALPGLVSSDPLDPLSVPSSAYSGSPAPSDIVPPTLFAPKPHRPFDWSAATKDLPSTGSTSDDAYAAHDSVDPLSAYIDMNALGPDMGTSYLADGTYASPEFSAAVPTDYSLGGPDPVFG